jgi:hypothetical protein
MFPFLKVRVVSASLERLDSTSLHKAPPANTKLTPQLGAAI